MYFEKSCQLTQVCDLSKANACFLRVMNALEMFEDAIWTEENQEMGSLEALGIDKTAPFISLHNNDFIFQFRAKVQSMHEPIMQVFNRACPSTLQYALADLSVMDIWNLSVIHNLRFAKSMQWEGFNPEYQTILEGVISEFYGSLMRRVLVRNILIEDGILYEA